MLLLLLIWVMIYLCVFTAVLMVTVHGFNIRERYKLLKKRLPEGVKKTSSVVLGSLVKPFGFMQRFAGSPQQREGMRRILYTAGVKFGVKEYMAIKGLVALGLPAIVMIIATPQRALSQPLLWLAIPGIVGFVLPALAIHQRAARRQMEILKALPTVIDLLILCIEGGMDFMGAIQKVTERTMHSALIEELHEMWRKIKIGTPRRDALKNWAWKMNLSETSSFARTVAQAEKMGSPMGEALRNLAEEIRFQQFQRGEQIALKAPIKMLFPLLLFILPAVLIIVAGPVFIQFLQSGVKFLQ